MFPRPTSSLVPRIAVGLRWAGLVGALSALLVVAPMSGPASAQDWLPEGERIPLDLSGELLTLDGNPVYISDYDDDVLIVNFWATWCGPCLAEMPSLEALQKQFEGRSVRILAITDESFETVRSFTARYPSRLTILIDKGGRLSQRLRIWSIPWTLVLDSHRRLIHFQVGAQRWDSPEVVRQLKEQLSE
jgi:thiol-disulfide isomerase/thioredoxin